MESESRTPRVIKITDSLFSTHSFGLAGENADKAPKTIEWDRTPGAARIKVFTDTCLDLAEEDESQVKIAMLIESPCQAREALEEIVRIHPNFDWVLTHRSDIIKEINGRGRGRVSKAFWYPLGGSWIDEEKITDTNKTKMVSILASNKQSLKGHRIRKEAGEFVPEEDRYGEMWGRYIESKREALVPYRYSVVTENCRSHLYFTEKLIDCFTTKTVPIYWGSPGNVLFNKMGVLRWNRTKDLNEILAQCSEEDYESRLEAIEDNYNRCQSYKCPEDTIMEYYSFMFEESA